MAHLRSEAGRIHTTARSATSSASCPPAVNPSAGGGPRTMCATTSTGTKPLRHPISAMSSSSTEVMPIPGDNLRLAIFTTEIGSPRRTPSTCFRAEARRPWSTQPRQVLLDGAAQSYGRTRASRAHAAGPMESCGMTVRGGVIVLVEPFGRRRRRCDRATVAAALAVTLDARWSSTTALAWVPLQRRRSLPAPWLTAERCSNTSAHAYTAALSERLPYDPIADFVPVAAVTSQAYVLVANPALGSSAWPIWRALAGHVQAACRSSRRAWVPARTCALPSSTRISVSARATPRLERRTGSAKRSRVSPAGEADYAVSPIPIAAPHLAAGTLVAIGVTAARRSPLLPDVPTLAEAGADGFAFPIWYGLWARPRTRGCGRRARGSGVRSAAITRAGIALRAARCRDPATDPDRVRRLRDKRGRTCAPLRLSRKPCGIA